MYSGEIKEKVVILLTATIDPQGMGFTSLTDPDIRMAHYLEAINFYLKETNLKIVFCENTGTDIYNKIVSVEKERRLEYLTYSGNDYDKNRGKGYGEMQIISHALKHSEYLKDCQFIIKITGRIKLLNVNEYIKNIRNIKNKRLNNTNEVWVDFFSEWYIISSVGFIINKGFLLYIISKYADKVHDLKFCFEKMLYQSISECQNLVIHPSIFRLQGICAGSNEEYMKISRLKHIGTNAFLLSKLNHIRGYHLKANLDILKYYFYRGLEKASLFFIKRERSV